MSGVGAMTDIVWKKSNAAAKPWQRVAAIAIAEALFFALAWASVLVVG